MGKLVLKIAHVEAGHQVVLWQGPSAYQQSMTYVLTATWAHLVPSLVIGLHPVNLSKSLRAGQPGRA